MEREVVVRMQETRYPETSFDELLTGVIVEGIKFILGEGTTQALIDNLKLREVTGDPAELHRRLFNTLGRGGSLLIEVRIINLLCSKLNNSFNIERCNERSFLETNWKLAKRAFDDTTKP